MKTDAIVDLTLNEFEIETPTDHPPSNRAETDPLRAHSGKSRLPRLSGVLRGLGGMVIVAAFVMYLFKGWQDGDELTRYLLLVGHTLVLSLVGFASGHLLHEGKGARLFIALALAAVPVNFAFLGGMSYGHLTWDTEGSIGMATGFWTTAAPSSPLSVTAVFSLTGATVLMLGAAIWIGFLVMARRSALPLTGLYLLTNAGLLIPTRDSAAVSAILIVLGLVLAVSLVRLRLLDQTLATAEGVFARGALALPLIVIAGRSIWLYAPGELFFATLSLIGYLGLRQALRHLEAESRWRVITEGLAVALAVFTTLFAFQTLTELRVLDNTFKLPIAAAVLAGLLMDLSRFATRRARALRGAAAFILATALVIDLIVFGGLVTATACLIGGLAIQVYGYGVRQKGIFAIGLIAALSGAGYLGTEALSSFSLGGWTGLVLTGIGIVLAGSIIERHGQRIKVTLGSWSRQFDNPTETG